jgi:hypothetical protein
MNVKAFYASLFSLFLVVFSNAEANTRSADIIIGISSTVDVTVSGQINNLELITEDRGFFIASAQVKVDDLSIKPGAAKAHLKKEKMLNSSTYPYVQAKNISCKSDSGKALEGDCTGSLVIKGIEKNISGIRYKVLTDDSIEIRFNFYLSDFNIAQKVFIFGIENEANTLIKVLP